MDHSDGLVSWTGTQLLGRGLHICSWCFYQAGSENICQDFLQEPLKQTYITDNQNGADVSLARTRAASRPLGHPVTILTHSSRLKNVETTVETCLPVPCLLPITGLDSTLPFISLSKKQANKTMRNLFKQQQSATFTHTHFSLP